MNKKSLYLALILSLGGASLSAENTDPTPQGKQEPYCYPASKCIGDPNTIGGDESDKHDYREEMGTESPEWRERRDSRALEHRRTQGLDSYDGSHVLKTDSLDRFHGTVQAIRRVNLPNETQIQMVLITDEGREILVILGPASYIDQAKIKMQAGDKVHVHGYIVKVNGETVVMAAEVKKNGNTLQLLDEQRRPMWQRYPH